MICPKCGSPVTDGLNYCPICGNDMRASDLDATVMADKSEITNQPAAPIAPPVQTAFVQPQAMQPAPTQQYANPPVAEPKKSKGSGTGLKIGIIASSVIAVAAIVFAVLVGTGTISFKKNETKEKDISTEEKIEIVEPEIGTVSEIPVITGNKSIKKAMMKIKDSGEEGAPSYMALDSESYSKPVFIMEMDVDSEYGEVAFQYAVYDGCMYYTSDDFFQGKTIAAKNNSAEDSMLIYFGQYDCLPKEHDAEFKYLGKEKVTTGDAFMYEYITGEDKYERKFWIDAETGYWVKMQEDGQTVFEVTEIITGDDVKLPEFDFENAIRDEEPEVGSVSDIPVVTGDETNEKVMLKLKTGKMDGGETLWYAADFSDQAAPTFYYEVYIDSGNGQKAKTQVAIVPGEYVYCTSEAMPGGTYKMKNGSEAYESAKEIHGLLFGRYDEDYLADNHTKFKYRGKEELATGSAYVYERTSDDTEGINVMWIDEDTGCCVKSEVNGETKLEVAEIITGNRVVFPEFDYANAIAME